MNNGIDNLSASEIKHLVDEWVFSERNRKVLLRRLIDGICYEPLAEEFDLSVRQAKNIVRDGVDTIRNHNLPESCTNSSFSKSS